MTGEKCTYVVFTSSKCQYFGGYCEHNTDKQTLSVEVFLCSPPPTTSKIILLQ